ncbi:uncharacterized protein LOC132733079 isoform X2 [Ruditapes philippinarum]|uniref:uncharacterized protein LOC132733079 isoform X2 n=1 Tax=Ruditapes philippinarum TaxID=129788 RepID=UPI00295BDE57|nr:uncharacterized protein LOC132733079 isoform X2 [Ruditapes philippinarum]
MAENDDLITEMNQLCHCLEQAIEEANENALTLKTEDGIKILQCIKKSIEKLDQGQPSETNNKSREKLDQGQPSEKNNKSREKLDQGQPSETNNKSREKPDQGQPSETKKKPRGKTKDIYVFISRTQGKFVQEIAKEFSNLLLKMSIHSTSFTGKKQLKDDSKLIALCPIVSRLESDIEHVLKELPKFSLSGRFALVVVNMKSEDNLPRLPTETNLDTDKAVYKNIEFIDMAFTPENQMYDCNMNRKATERIQSFVNNTSQK